MCNEKLLRERIFIKKNIDDSIEDKKKYRTLTIKMPEWLAVEFYSTCKKNEIAYSKAVRSFIIRFVNGTAYCRYCYDYACKKGLSSDEKSIVNDCKLYIRIQAKLLSEFKKKCKQKGLSMCAATRLFMSDYICGNDW